MKTILLISHSSDTTGGGEEDFLKLLKYLYGKYYIFAIFPEGQKVNEYIPYCNKYRIIKSTVFPFLKFSVRGYLAYFVKNIKKVFQIYSFIRENDRINVCYLNSSVCFLDAMVVYFFCIPYIISIKENINPHFVRKIIANFYSLTSKIIITLSEYLKNEYENVDKNIKIKIVHSALDEFYYENIIKDSKKRISDKENFRILNIGSIFYQKGQHILIEALNNFTNKNNVKLKIIGEVKDQEYSIFIKEKIKNYNLDNIVSLCGKMSKKDLISEILDSDAIVISSLEEGQSLVLLEGLFIGKPVITSNVGIVPEIIKDGFNGLIYKNNNPAELAEKINLLLKDQLLYNNIVNEGRKTYLENFSLLKSLQAIENELINASKN